MAWVIDPAHSEIQFSAKHLMISTVRGRFNVFTGTIGADENNPTAAKVDVQIDASSLVTGEERWLTLTFCQRFESAIAFALTLIIALVISIALFYLIVEVAYWSMCERDDRRLLDSRELEQTV